MPPIQQVCPRALLLATRPQALTSRLPTSARPRLPSLPAPSRAAASARTAHHRTQQPDCAAGPLPHFPPPRSPEALRALVDADKGAGVAASFALEADTAPASASAMGGAPRGARGRCDPVVWDCGCEGVRTCGTGWLP
ncbi:hypothetical protein JCM3770_000879 [Rhodotorula araucariae]